MKVLPEYRDQNGNPGFSIRRWDGTTKQYVWVPVPVTPDELRIQQREPVRLSSEPKYWLYRNRFVLHESATSEPDDFVDVLEVIVDDGASDQHDGPRREALIKEKTKALEQLMSEAGVPLRFTSWNL